MKQYRKSQKFILHKACSPSDTTDEPLCETGIKSALPEKFSNGNPLPAAERRGFFTALDVSLILFSAITLFALVKYSCRGRHQCYQ